MSAAVLSPAVVSSREAAAYIGVSLRTLERLLSRDEALRRAAVYLTPRLRRFKVKRLQAWLDKRPDSARPGGAA